MPQRGNISSILIIGAGPNRGAPPPPLRGRDGVGGQRHDGRRARIAVWHLPSPGASALTRQKPSTGYGRSCVGGNWQGCGSADKYPLVLTSSTSCVTPKIWLSRWTAGSMPCRSISTQCAPGDWRVRGFMSSGSGTTTSWAAAKRFSKPFGKRSPTPPLPDPPPRGRRGSKKHAPSGGPS